MSLTLKLPALTRLRSVAVLLVLLSSLLIGVVAQPASKVTLATVRATLVSKKTTLAQRNKTLTASVTRRGVSFELTSDVENDLLALGASDALIDAIRKSSGPRAGSASASSAKIPAKTKAEATAAMRRGDQAFAAQNFDIAISEYKKAIDLNPELGLAYFRRGMSYNYMGNISKAYDDYDAAVKVSPSLAEETLTKCIIYKTGTDAYGVVHFCNEVIAKDKDFSLAYFKRAVAQRDLKNNDQAISDYGEAIRIYPGFGYVYNSRAALNIELKKDYSQAISDTTTALRYLPNLDAAYYNRGLAYFDLKNYNSAIPDFRRAVELKPTDADSYNYLGRSYFELKDYTTAMPYFTNAIKYDPTNVEPFRYRGICYYYQKDYQLALLDYTEAIRLAPSPNAYMNRSYVYEAMGRTDLAAADKQKSDELKRNPKP